ncbi:secretoglobin family 2A member 2-like [Anolis carolinensis]|uniref:secretoglobin family 2A member 2-like n=1 Tax=Anolis carolinensis TaxID=28377 RepID=UPI0004628AB9
MKLTVVFLLVTLMVCCYSDTAVEVCPPIEVVLNKFFFSSMTDYMKMMAPFATSPEMTEAASRLKQCTLEATQEELLAKEQLLKNILAMCGLLPKLPEHLLPRISEDGDVH